MVFRDFSSGKYNLKAKMGDFGAKTRNSDFRNKIIIIKRLPSDLWGPTIPTHYRIAILFQNAPVIGETS